MLELSKQETSLELQNIVGCSDFETYFESLLNTRNLCADEIALFEKEVGNQMPIDWVKIP